MHAENTASGLQVCFGQKMCALQGQVVSFAVSASNHPPMSHPAESLLLHINTGDTPTLQSVHTQPQKLLTFVTIIRFTPVNTMAAVVFIPTAGELLHCLF